MRRYGWGLVVALLSVGPVADAQEPRVPVPPAPKPATPASPALKLGSVDVSVLWRSRVELWDWFEAAPPADGGYVFMNSMVRVGFGQTKKSTSWRLELMQPTYLGAPDDAVAPAPQGALGLGASYFGANERRTSFGHLFLKQAFLQFTPSPSTTVKAGRFEFIDGTETRIQDPTVAALVQSRVAHRLLSNEAFPAAQRSVDGATVSWNSGPNNVTAFGARVVAGGVHLNGWKELDIEVYYGAYNRTVKAAHGAGAFRAFGVG